MNKDLIVEIFVPTKGHAGKQGEIATGYPVAKNRILTARHPFFPANAARDPNHPIEVRWQLHPDVDHDRWWVAHLLTWDGDEDCDAAVLDCEFPPAINRWGTLSDRPSHDHLPWASHGFPRVGGKKNNKRQGFPMKGTAYSMSTVDTTFAVGTDDGPDNADDWKGASGSPIMVNGCIRGIALSVPPDLNAKRFDVLASRTLLAISGFREAIDYSDASTRVDLLCDEVVAALEASPQAMNALAKQLVLRASALPDENDPDRVEGIATALLGQPLEFLITATRKAHRALTQRRDEDAATVITNVTHAVLPAVFDQGVIEQVYQRRFDRGLALLDLPAAATTTVAEIIMAGSDSRKTAFLAPVAGKKTVSPIYAIPLLPTTGIDPDYKTWTKDLEEYLESKLGKAFIDAEDYAVLRSDGQREQRQRQLLANRLRSEADEQRTRYVVFRFIDEAERLRALISIQTLKDRYPQLVFLDLSRDPTLLVEQRDVFQPFENIINPPEART